MKLGKMINEIKGELKKGDEITLPSSPGEIWTVKGEDGDYYDIKNNNSGVDSRLSKYNTSDVKRVPIFEYMTPDDKKAEIVRYNDDAKKVRAKMKKYSGNSKKGVAYQRLEKDLSRIEMALKLCSKKTPYMGIY